MTTTAVKGILTTVDRMKQLASEAEVARAKLSETIDRANTSVSKTHQLAEELDAAVNALDGALGQHSNFPPLDL